MPTHLLLNLCTACTPRHIHYDHIGAHIAVAEGGAVHEAKAVELYCLDPGARVDCTAWQAHMVMQRMKEGSSKDTVVHVAKWLSACVRPR